MAFPDGVADFRSDTVTRPTAEMLAAMAAAEVGDDAYGDDPTVKALEEESAAVVGKEAAVFVPSGTMGNQLAIMFHTNPGEEVLANEGSHARSTEAGAAQALSSVAFRTVSSDDGGISPEDVEEALEMVGFFPRIGLLLWENTHNLAGGRVLSIGQMRETSALAREHGLRVHLDGARIFNAVAASGVQAADYASVADTVQFCFSKGLGAPIGSIICATREAADEIRYLRKRLGGGMRQVGVIAAAARVALAGRSRLGADHELARVLAEGLDDRFPGSVDLDAVETNIIKVTVGSMGMSWTEVSDRLSKASIKVNPPRGSHWRLVTHRDVDAADVDRLLTALK